MLNRLCKRGYSYLYSCPQTDLLKLKLFLFFLRSSLPWQLLAHWTSTPRQITLQHPTVRSSSWPPLMEMNSLPRTLTQAKTPTSTRPLTARPLGWTSALRATDYSCWSPLTNGAGMIWRTWRSSSRSAHSNSILLWKLLFRCSCHSWVGNGEVSKFLFYCLRRWRANAPQITSALLDLGWSSVATLITSPTTCWSAQ